MSEDKVNYNHQDDIGTKLEKRVNEGKIDILALAISEYAEHGLDSHGAKKITAWAEEIIRRADYILPVDEAHGGHGDTNDGMRHFYHFSNYWHASPPWAKGLLFINGHGYWVGNTSGNQGHIEYSSLGMQRDGIHFFEKPNDTDK